MMQPKQTVNCAHVLPSRFLWVTILICSALWGNSQAHGQQFQPKDRIFFTNGDSSTGKVINLTADKVVFLGDLTGEVSYQRKDIARIELQPLSRLPEFPLEQHYANATGLQRSFLEANGNFQGVSAGAGTATPSAAEPQAGSSPAAEKIPTWSGSLSSQNSVTRSTQGQYSLGGNLHIARETQAQKAWEHQIINFDAQAAFGESSKPKSSPIRTAVFEGGLQDSLFIVNSERIGDHPHKYDSAYLFALGSAYHNLSLGIDVQQSYGIGFGWQRTLKGKKNKNDEQVLQLFGLDADLRYVHQVLYAPGVTHELAATSASENYSVVVPVKGPKPFQFFERLSVIPSFNEGHELQVRGLAGFAWPLTCRASLGPRVTDDYFRNAPRNLKQNYLQVALTLSYNFNILAPAVASRCK